jgi:hypothetical protein
MFEDLLNMTTELPVLPDLPDGVLLDDIITEHRIVMNAPVEHVPDCAVIDKFAFIMVGIEIQAAADASVTKFVLDGSNGYVFDVVTAQPGQTVQFGLISLQRPLPMFASFYIALRVRVACDNECCNVNKPAFTFAGCLNAPQVPPGQFTLLVRGFDSRAVWGPSVWKRMLQLQSDSPQMLRHPTGTTHRVLSGRVRTQVDRFLRTRLNDDTAPLILAATSTRLEMQPPTAALSRRRHGSDFPLVTPAGKKLSAFPLVVLLHGVLEPDTRIYHRTVWDSDTNRAPTRLISRAGLPWLPGLAE